MSKPTAHPLAKYQAHVESIGMISLETVDLELHLADLFARMLFISRRVGRAIFMTPKADQVRIDILRHAARAALEADTNSDPKGQLSHQKAQALKKVLDIANRSQQAFNERHRAMHDDWGIDREMKEIVRRRVDGAPGRPAAPIPIEQLNNQIEVLRRLIDDVIDLTNEFDENPPMLADMRKTSKRPDKSPR